MCQGRDSNMIQDAKSVPSNFERRVQRERGCACVCVCVSQQSRKSPSFLRVSQRSLLKTKTLPWCSTQRGKPVNLQHGSPRHGVGPYAPETVLKRSCLFRPLLLPEEGVAGSGARLRKVTHRGGLASLSKLPPPALGPGSEGLGFRISSRFWPSLDGVAGPRAEHRLHPVRSSGLQEVAVRRST